MWYPCQCSDCDTIVANNLNNAAWVDNEMGSFPVMHAFLSHPAAKMGYQPPGMRLHRSATCGFMPTHHFSPWKDDFSDQQHLINGRLAITDGKVQDVDDDDDIVKAKLTIRSSQSVSGSTQAQHDTNLAEDGLKKFRDYSDDSLTPDSTLPAVIRRRNRNRRKKLATSMVDPTSGGAPWEGETAKPPPRTRSHSVSDDQWAQMLAAEANTTTNTQSLGAPSGPTCPPGHVPADMSAFAGAATRRGYNSINNSGRSGGGTLGRGMVSSASVCDLNTLAQQQPLHGFSNAAGSFQQLNMMGYGGGMMWGAPCDLCQAPAMFTGHPGISGMKRTASNLSMNLSSVGSDMSGYPWAPPPHIHHHMPMYPGYYPGYHPHMAPPPMGTPMGLNMSIPDSMHTFGKVPSSPAPSVRSSSHRSHKSAKSRSFNAADTSGRRSRNRKVKRSEESEESRSTSVSEDEDDIDDRESKSGHGGVSSLAWQCDHCTFINSGGARTCGMCSKTVGGSGRSSRRGSERRRSERRRDRRTDQEDNERDVSDYDNDGGVVKSNFSFNIKDSKREARNKVSGSNKSKSKKKSRRRDGSESQSESGSEGEEEEQLERHMRDLRVSSSSRRRGSDHDGGNNKDRDRERTSRKKEGKLRWKD